MKKDYHITINLNENDYKKIIDNASKEDRNITNYCYLIIKKHLEELKERN